ncbi:hypothetical protein BHM03_00046027 [Ensete ventricosum]|nr:hypothetical protein BHM03_00046027 [Ensete ventricosum]
MPSPRALFAEFKIGQPPSPTKSQRGESSERPPQKEGQPSDMLQPRMRVDFPRWEEGDPARWSALNVTSATTERRTMLWWKSLSSTLNAMQSNDKRNGSTKTLGG